MSHFELFQSLLADAVVYHELQTLLVVLHRPQLLLKDPQRFLQLRHLEKLKTTHNT